jgi:hypothetical protein
MSTTAGEIIVQAFREGNFTPLGHTSTAEELTEAIPRLSSFVSSLFGVEIGEEYRDWPAPTAWPSAQEQRHPLTPLSSTTTTVPWQYPPQNSRILLTISSTKTLYFPAQPADGARMMLNDIGSVANPTLHGNGRKIEGGLTLTGTPGALDGHEWFYRADLGNWILLERITASGDELPLPQEFDDLFVTGLAIRLATRFGAQLPPAVEAKYAEMLTRVQARYKESARPKSAAELRTLLRTTP